MEDSEAEIQKMVKQVHEFGLPKMKVKATLLQVYHLALHNDVIKAKDLL